MKQKMYRHGDLLIMQVEQVKGKHALRRGDGRPV
jgi:hypothetical protein